MEVHDVVIAHIEPFRDRDRDPEKFMMLARSMEKYGLIEPIIVAPGDGGKRYRLIAGHGRLRAAKKLRWQKIRAVVRDKFELKDFLVENWRRDLSPYEQAVLVELALQMGKPADQVAEEFAISRSLVSQYVTIIRNLSPDLQKYVREKKMTVKDAHAIARKLPEQKAQEILVKTIQEGEKIEPPERAVKRAVGDILGAVKYRGTMDSITSVEKLHKIREEVAEQAKDTKDAMTLVRSHWMRSVGELRLLCKDRQYRKLFEKHGIDYAPIL